MKFGTDGIRGKFGAEITLELAEKFGMAFASNRMAYGMRSAIAIGRDSRVSGPALEEAIARGMSMSGADVILAGIIPTPALSQFVISNKLAGGIMITASHNPPDDNGIKPMDEFGRKLSPSNIGNIQKILLSEMVRSSNPGRIYEVTSGANPWLQKIWNWIKFNDLENTLLGETIIVDSANGAGRNLISAALSPFGAKMIEISNEDGSKINLDCGSLHPDGMVDAVKRTGAIAGIALDGDGDRIQICDRLGRLYDGDDILWMLKMPNSKIVGTTVSNYGLEKSLSRAGVVLHRSDVGDSNVYQKMIEVIAPIGGEPSGHILFSDGMPTSCGTYTAMRLLALSPRKWESTLNGLIKTHQAIGKVPTQDTSHLTEMIKELSSSGLKVIIRASGTEPVIRLMVEGEDKEKAESGLNSLLNMLSS